MHASVRNNLMAQGRLTSLQPQDQVELAILFGLEPARDALLSRLYLRPLLAIAALAGNLALRRKSITISDPVAAGGLIALEEVTGAAFAITEPYPRRDADIMALQERIAGLLLGAGVRPADLARAGRQHLRTGEAVSIAAVPGPIRFFLD
jgi:hypothetical protein